ncbi:uncharacterized protein LOC112560685 [Pomacea canaliculata]|uniref:uncharacterized protein LOC112560685 n=1 Tax=Pomacea canaliculata TaxID=400727 RepID=UPI000D737432|nr:uncharacterized protein LOC112560685 [Pomacea canaliculata]
MGGDLCDTLHKSRATGVKLSNPQARHLTNRQQPKDTNAAVDDHRLCWMTVSLACSCKKHRGRHYCMEDVVFLGKAVAEYQENSESWNETEGYDPWGMRIYTFEVDTIFWSKGSTDAMTTVNITTEIDSGLCGEEFDLNTDYVIAASDESGKLTTHLCSGNRNWDELKERRKKFFTSGLTKLCAHKTSKTKF